MAVIAASRAVRASPAKCCFIAMTMRKATPPEDETATFSRVGNCWRALSRKEDFRDVAPGR